MPRILFSRVFWTAFFLILGVAVFFLFPPAEGSNPSPPNPVIAIIFFGFILFFSQYSEINSAINKAQYSRAIELAERLRKLDPRMAYSTFALAYAGLRQGEDSLVYAEKAIELAPRNAHFYAIRAVAKLVLHDFENALLDCTKAAELDPASAYAFVLKAECYLSMNQPQEAMTELKKAQAIPTKWAIARSYVSSTTAIAELALGRPQSAKVAAQDSISAQNSAFAHGAMGLVLLVESDFDAAIAEFSEAIQLNEYCADAYWYRHVAYLATGKTDLAKADKEHALRLGAFPYPMFRDFGLSS